MYNDSYTHINLVLCYITQSLWGLRQTVNNTFMAHGMAYLSPQSQYQLCSISPQDILHTVVSRIYAPRFATLGLLESIGGAYRAMRLLERL